MGNLSNLHRYLTNDLLLVCTPLMLMCLLIYTSNAFASVKTEVGFSHYAETPMIFEPISKKIMPLNTVVNITYFIVGFYWLLTSSKYYGRNLISSDQFFFYRIFSWMTIFYGPVQFLRILYQTHELAVLDQWCTLPFFQWIFIWCLFTRIKYSARIALVLVIVSLLSYFLSIPYKNGFEITLGIHILLVLLAALYVNYFFDIPNCNLDLCRGIFCCFGFIFFKVLDLKLKNLGFDYVSGHFLSKICDCMQIHYGCKFLLKIFTYKLKIQ